MNATTEDKMPLMALLQKRGGGDFLRESADLAPHRLMDAKVEGLVGAGRRERSDTRVNAFLDRRIAAWSRSRR